MVDVQLQLLPSLGTSQRLFPLLGEKRSMELLPLMLLVVSHETEGHCINLSIYLPLEFTTGIFLTATSFIYENTQGLLGLLVVRYLVGRDS